MKKTTFLIVGKHAVLEALKNPSRKIERIFVTEDAQKKLNSTNNEVANVSQNIVDAKRDQNETDENKTITQIK